MQPVRSVIIVGAGSAGWLTALVLTTYCPFLKVSLIRPRKGSPIGVGESTQADFLSLLMAGRVDVPAFYRACDASMKCGVYYEDWNAVGEHYWHPFSHLAQRGAYTPAHHYQQLILEDPARFSHESYYAAVHASYATCVRNRQVDPESAIAFHVDAQKITAFLERLLTNVEVLEADDVDVRTGDGRVSGIALGDSRVVSADLYVDCTGFSRVLFEHVASPEIMPYEANVNRVVAAQLPYVDADEEFTPYTRAHAHEHGWTWSIPLQSRIGSGYVYHGDFCSPEQAERNFRAYWGARTRDVEVRHISFDSATLRNPWVENVVAVGLSAGFVEPLEATGLNWIIMSADTLCRSLASSHSFDSDTSAKYNASMLGYIHDVHDFIDVHYKLSARRDSEFWKYQTSRAYPERLEQRLAVYAAEMPNYINRVKTGPWAFNEVSWIDILNGYRFPYAKLDVDPGQKALAQQALQTIAAGPKRGLDPRTCVPNAQSPAAPQAQSIA